MEQSCSMIGREFNACCLQIKKRVQAVEEGLQQGIMEMEEDEDGHLNIKLKKEVMEKLRKKQEGQQEGSSAEYGFDGQEMSEEELGARSLDGLDLEKMEEELKELSEKGDPEEVEKWLQEQEALLDIIGASQSEKSKVPHLHSPNFSAIHFI